jgi:hypothetical protein
MRYELDTPRVTFALKECFLFFVICYSSHRSYLCTRGLVFCRTKETNLQRTIALTQATCYNNIYVIKIWSGQCRWFTFWYDADICLEVQTARRMSSYLYCNIRGCNLVLNMYTYMGEHNSAREFYRGPSQDILP